jgi:hypothetical protein
MEENILTVVGVIALGISYSLTDSFIKQSEEGNILNTTIPFGLSFGSAILIMWAIAASGMTFNMKGVMVTILIAIIILEFWFFLKKPTTWYGVSSARVVTFLGSLFKLWILVSVHCGITTGISGTTYRNIKSLFGKDVAAVVTQVKRDVPEPRPDQPVADWNKATAALDLLSRKAGDVVTKEDKDAAYAKMREAFGKPPKVGGRR